MTGHLYATRGQLKSRLTLNPTDTSRDELLDALLAGTSRLIERETGRIFYPLTATRYVRAGSSGELYLNDDLLSVATLKTDDDGDRTWPTTWTTDDFDLEPASALSGPVPEPYHEIALNPNSSLWFPAYRRGVQVVGEWGYYDVRRTLVATVNETWSASDTGLTVTAIAEFDVGQTLRIESEQVYVSAISGVALTVLRGQNGTTAATHASGTAIAVYEYPLIGEACLQQATLAKAAAETPGGMRGGGEISSAIVSGGLHPFVRAMLSSFIRRGFA